MKKAVICIVCVMLCLVCSLVRAKTYLLPDWQDAKFDFETDISYDEPLCEEAVDEYGNKLYHKAVGCSSPKVFDETCPHNSAYISECYCPNIFSKKCNSPYVGDYRVTDSNSGYSSCDGYWIACCDTSCPGGTTRTDPGGCGGYTYNGCGDICYYPYEACCTPLADDTDCDYGVEDCSDGCGGTRTCCKGCVPLSDETACAYGTESCSNGCGGTRQCCKACTPATNETGCSYGTYSCSDGCGGTRTCCSDAPDCDSSYKYSCTGTGYSGGSGTACGGEYTECICSSGYEWSGSACISCGSSYKYTCTSGSNVTGGLGTACGGMYTACTCANGYSWSSGSCVGCPVPMACAYGCATYSPATSDCPSVCNSCNPLDDPCDGVTCPTAKNCTDGCELMSHRQIVVHLFVHLVIRIVTDVRVDINRQIHHICGLLVLRKRNLRLVLVVQPVVFVMKHV